MTIFQCDRCGNQTKESFFEIRSWLIQLHKGPRNCTEPERGFSGDICGDCGSELEKWLKPKPEGEVCVCFPSLPPKRNPNCRATKHVGEK